MEIILTGIIVFIISIVVSRKFTEQAMKLISADERTKLMEAFASDRNLRLVALTLIVVIFFIFRNKFPESGTTGFILYTGVLLGLFIVRAVRNQIKLKTLQLPARFVSLYRNSALITLVGLLLLFASVYLQYLN